VADGARLYPIIFLRDDIYDLIQDSDKNKWGDFRVDLNWDEAKIKKVMAFRISRAIDPTCDHPSASERRGTACLGSCLWGWGGIRIRLVRSSSSRGALYSGRGTSWLTCKTVLSKHSTKRSTTNLKSKQYRETSRQSLLQLPAGRAHGRTVCNFAGHIGNLRHHSNCASGTFLSRNLKGRIWTSAPWASKRRM